MEESKIFCFIFINRRRRMQNNVIYLLNSFVIHGKDVINFNPLCEQIDNSKNYSFLLSFVRKTKVFYTFILDDHKGINFSIFTTIMISISMSMSHTFSMHHLCSSYSCERTNKVREFYFIVFIVVDRGEYTTHYASTVIV